MPTDEERREVVARLREWLAIPWYERPWSRDAMQDLGKMVGAVPGENIYERVADLIDRPTCSMDKTDSFLNEVGETVNIWECSNCGQECEEINGSYEFCPHCGAEVVGDED